MKPDLHGKIAVVTGASRGLGRRVAIRLAVHGAKVALVSRNAEQLRETQRMIEANGGVAQSFPCEIGNAGVVDMLKTEIERCLGIPTILIHAAGIFGPIQLMKDSDAARWIETITTNTIGPYLTCRAFADGMIRSGWGRIV